MAARLAEKKLTWKFDQQTVYYWRYGGGSVCGGMVLGVAVLLFRGVRKGCLNSGSMVLAVCLMVVFAMDVSLSVGLWVVPVCV